METLQILDNYFQNNEKNLVNIIKDLLSCKICKNYGGCDCIHCDLCNEPFDGNVCECEVCIFCNANILTDKKEICKVKEDCRNDTNYSCESERCTSCKIIRMYVDCSMKECKNIYCFTEGCERNFSYDWKSDTKNCTECEEVFCNDCTEGKYQMDTWCICEICRNEYCECTDCFSFQCEECDLMVVNICCGVDKDKDIETMRRMCKKCI